MPKQKHNFARTVTTVVILSVASFLDACGDGSSATDEVAVEDKPSVLFICVDTLRDDHMGAGGYRRKTTPNLDILSAQGTRFRHCFSAYPQTAASVASIFTSLYPTAHKVRPKEMILSNQPALLADVFRNAGYRTGAVASNPHLSPGLGFERGFERFYYVHGNDVQKSTYGDRETLGDVEIVYRKSDAIWYGRADAMNLAALEWLDELDGDQPFFLYLHYMDVHSPYESPPKFQRRFVRGKLSRQGKNIYRNGVVTEDVEPYDLAYTIALYDGGISYIDHMLTRVLTEMGRRGHMENTYIVFVSDHGDEFLEHGGMGHGKTLHRELVDVPFFVVGPDVRPQTIDLTVSTLDLFPTLCDLVGIDMPTGLQGQSLAPILRGESGGEANAAGRYVLSECDEARLHDDDDDVVVSRYALADDEWRLIHCPERGTSELFRYRADPREENDLAADEPERVERMVAEANRLLEVTGVLGASIKSQKAELYDDALDELRRLGYGGE